MVQVVEIFPCGIQSHVYTVYLYHGIVLTKNIAVSTPKWLMKLFVL